METLGVFKETRATLFRKWTLMMLNQLLVQLPVSELFDA